MRSWCGLCSVITGQVPCSLGRKPGGGGGREGGPFTSCQFPRAPVHHAVHQYNLYQSCTSSSTASFSLSIFVNNAMYSKSCARHRHHQHFGRLHFTAIIISFPSTQEDCTSIIVFLCTTCSSQVGLYCTFLFLFAELREVQQHSVLSLSPCLV